MLSRQENHSALKEVQKDAHQCRTLYACADTQLGVATHPVIN